MSKYLIRVKGSSEETYYQDLEVEAASEEEAKLEAERIISENDILVKDIFDSIVKALRKTSDLVFPIQNFSREQIVKELKDARLFEHTTWCDSMLEADHCGKCRPCISHSNYLRRFMK